MPIYEYECPVCGKIIEAFCHISDKQVRQDCHTCKKKMERIISVPAKPRGWKLEYSHALGRYVKNKRDYVDGLKKTGADYKLIMDTGEY